MAPWEQFEATFQFNRNIAYDKKTVDQILANRRALENQLFIDRLLGLLGVKGGTCLLAVVLDGGMLNDRSTTSISSKNQPGP